MKPYSIRFKATVFYSSILALILLVFGLSVLGYSYYILIKGLDKSLNVKAKEIAAIFNAYGKVVLYDSHPLAVILNVIDEYYFDSSAKAALNKLWTDQFSLLDLDKDYIVIVNSDKKPVLHSKDTPKFFYSENLSKFFFLDKIVHKIFYANKIFVRGINYPFDYNGSKLVVYVYTPMRAVLNVMMRLIVFVFVAIALIVVFTIYVGGIFAGQILRPVERLTDLAETISHKNLSLRIEEEAGDIEMQKLVDAFNDMINRLEKSFSYISDFSSNVAHELKTPLAVIKGELELAVENEEVSDETKNTLFSCLDEIERMERIINDLLLISKMENKPGFFHIEPINAKNFFNEICENANILAVPKKIKVAVNEIADDIIIYADKTHAKRLFLNIVANAIKFTGENGMVDIFFGYNKTGRLYVSVKDTGMGIKKDELDKIFKRFYRSDEARKYGGTGLGLSIALAVANAHGWKIDVNSEFGRGTEFVITL